MFQSFARSDSSPPPLSLLFAESRVLGEWARGARENAGIARAHDGRGHPVMVLPGFMVSDGRMALLKATLRQAGYRAHGWGQGRNLGVTADMLERLDARMDHIERQSGGPVTLLGWSLGGLIAREYAKFAPRRVARVITMGSPFSGSPRANHAWRLYEWVAKHPVDAPPIEARLAEKPPVPTYALWSRRDGVVAPASARGLSHEVDAAFEVDCTHLSFACAPEAMTAVLDVLARQPASADTGTSSPL
jgi:pimeloyl-ACP methyl ester carboxylesterase